MGEIDFPFLSVIHPVDSYSHYCFAQKLRTGNLDYCDHFDRADLVVQIMCMAVLLLQVPLRVSMLNVP